MLNIYCDESGHLEHDGIPVMCIGGIAIENEFRKTVYNDIREIKMKHNVSVRREIKWTKVSQGELNYYKNLVKYFFENDRLRFRAVVIPDKAMLNHNLYHQTSDEFYYKTYFLMLKKIISVHRDANIFIDIKDTNSNWKVRKLTNYLNSYAHTTDIKIHQIRSHENSILQLTDLIMGCIMYKNRGLSSSPAKKELSLLVEKLSKSDLQTSSQYSNLKFNIFIFNPQKGR